MQAEDALQHITRQLDRRRGMMLSQDSESELHERLIVARERAMDERDEGAFDSAVEQLSERLVMAMPTAIAAGVDEEERPQEVDTDALAVALRDICPLWPFC